MTRGPHSSPSSIAIAAPVATPTAGSATLLAPPAPNPIPYPAAPLQTLASGQYNSNFYAVVYNLLALEVALNSSYTCPSCVSSIVNNAAGPLTLATSTPGGNGVALTLGLNHGTDFVDTTTSQTISGPKTFSGGFASNGITNTGAEVGTSATYSSVVQGSALQSKAGGATAGYAAPMYSFAGTALAGSTHDVEGVVTATTSGSCGVLAQCTLTGNVATFAGVAIFASNPICHGTLQNTGQIVLASVTPATGSATVGIINIGSGAIASLTAIPVEVSCRGA